jgi:hypothetical protein
MRFGMDEIIKMHRGPNIRSDGLIHVVDEHDNPIREDICRWTHGWPRCMSCPLYEPEIIGQIKISKELAEDIRTGA